MKPYYDHAGITIYHGDCREILPHLPQIDLVLTDPPYGMSWTGKVTTGKNSTHKTGEQTRHYDTTIVGDNVTFDPTPFIVFDRVILFGCNHYAERLPVGTTLVWIKRADTAFGSFLSDAEIAWQKGGHGVYCYRDLSMQAESKYRKHPAQKPLPLMKWCINRAGGNGTILDPFMGSGTTLRAAKDLGRKCIGVEISEKYCEIAAKRLSQEVLAL